MAAIVPAILARSKEEIAALAGRLSFVPGIREVQLDVVDGLFARPACWPYTELSALRLMKEAGEYLPEVGRLSYDIDLMVGQPERDLALWTHLGATRLTLHVESLSDIARLLRTLRHQHGHGQTRGEGMLEVGLAIGIKTDLSLIEPYLDRIDYVQVMGIAHIGSQGQPFDDQAIRRIKALKRYAPGLTVQVDGGVDLETAPRLLSVGADRLVVGHAIVKAEDPVAAYEKFDRIAREYSGSVLG